MRSSWPMMAATRLRDMRGYLRRVRRGVVRQAQEGGFETGRRDGQTAQVRRTGPETGEDGGRHARWIVGIDPYPRSVCRDRLTRDQTRQVGRSARERQLDHADGMLGDHVVDAAPREHPAALEDGEGRAELFDLGEIVRGVDDGGAVAREATNDCQELGPRL